MIDLRGIAKHFGARSALAPLDLRVAPGEIVALVGPNGAGKSTCLRIVAGVIAPSVGTATVDGRDVVGDGIAARRRLGYLSQRLGVPAGTVVADLVALVAAVRGVPRADAIAAVGDAGLADRLGATLAELSGGQRQRLMLALATLGDVGALLLDEPSISLDTEGADEVRDAIRAAQTRGAAVLFASHYLHDVALLADRIVVMVDGRVTAQGSLPDLAAAAGVHWGVRDEMLDPPIERIYRVLVRRGRGTETLRMVRGDAA
jgi:ABC-2 type transport system ATP-binding protein